MPITDPALLQRGRDYLIDATSYALQILTPEGVEIAALRSALTDAWAADPALTGTPMPIAEDGSVADPWAVRGQQQGSVAYPLPFRAPPPPELLAKLAAQKGA